MYYIYQVCYLRNAVAGAWTGLDHSSTTPLCRVEKSANFPSQHVRNQYLQPFCQFATTVMIVEIGHGVSRLSTGLGFSDAVTYCLYGRKILHIYSHSWRVRWQAASLSLASRKSLCRFHHKPDRSLPPPPSTFAFS
jgi:hypothetical protein